MNVLSLKLERVRIKFIVCSKKGGDNISIVYINVRDSPLREIVTSFVSEVSRYLSLTLSNHSSFCYRCIDAYVLK